MKHFVIVHKRRKNNPLAYLEYDTDKRNFYLHIRKDVPMPALPVMLRLCAQKGIYDLDEEWSMRWVQERIIPRDRQGLGMVLKQNGMTHYDECTILEKSMGASVRDDYLVIPDKCTSPMSPSDIKQIRERENLSQSVFAAALGVSKKTVEAWESGRNKPSGSAEKLLRIVREFPDVIKCN